MNFNWRQVDIRIYAVLTSLFISTFTILVPQHTNDDAYAYIRTAEIFSTDGFSAAFQHYSWASYSILISLLGLLGIKLFTAAYLINALFFALLVFAFISIVREIDDSESLLVFAAVSILVYPELNEYRYFVIRDVGFWAFSVFALWQFLLYTKQPILKYGLGFCVSLIVATMLRVEAIVYLLMTPFALLLDYRFELQQRRNRFLKLIQIIGAAAGASFILLLLIGLNIQQLFLEFVSVYKPFLLDLFSPDAAESYEISRALFNEHAAAYSQEYIALFIVAGLTAMLFAKLISGIGGPYLVVLIFGLFGRKLRLNRHIALPIVFYLLVNLLILFTFVFVTRYLSSRYTILMCILLGLFIPLILFRLLQNARSNRKNFVKIFIVLFVTYCVIDSYYSFGRPKDYIDNAIDWIVQQRETPGGLVTNSHALAYNSGKIEDYDKTLFNLTAIDILDTAPGDLVAVELRYEMEQLFSSDDIARVLELEIEFSDADRRRIAIYRRIQGSPL
ncbi:MAG TPA: hypothetical protein EYO00_04145 [Gammaproteobacteria bacterium]|jgi:hypothetical protein|nr:hypothetical protein [Gammaproteobacteria bacterium]HIF87184.1 hypothetical protein [Gammaproteobacteria bacterium]HIL62947.1 hypothetical protein [Porticoccaceae bacterium]HIN89832.1 hypothetical protein [Porticoccaceae bacterium]